MRLKRGENMCDIAKWNSYPIIERKKQTTGIMC